MRHDLGLRVFKEMEDDIARDVCASMTIHTFRHGDTLLRENTELYKFWIILDGTVEVCVGYGC